MRIVTMGSTNGLGGLQTHFRLLVDFLIKEGHEVGTISVGDVPASAVAGNTFSAILTHSTSTPMAKMRKALEFWRAREVSNRFAPELFIAAATGRAYAGMSKGMQMSTFRFYQEVQYDIQKGDPMRLHMASSFDAIAAQSPAIGSIYHRQVTMNKPVRILPCFAQKPNGDSLPITPAAAETLRFCFFGRLASNKGLAQFLKAFAKIAYTDDASLDIHGAGPERDHLEKLVEQLGLTDRVRLCGPYPEGIAYAKLLASYHCMILPSTNCEGLPLVLIEAMSYGLPFLATNIGAIPDAAIDNEDVMLMSPDEDSIVHSLHKFGNKLRRGLVSCSRLREYYSRNFSSEVFEESWRSMLRDPRSFFA